MARACSCQGGHHVRESSGRSLRVESYDAEENVLKDLSRVSICLRHSGQTIGGMRCVEHHQVAEPL